MVAWLHSFARCIPANHPRGSSPYSPSLERHGAESSPIPALRMSRSTGELARQINRIASHPHNGGRDGESEGSTEARQELSGEASRSSESQKERRKAAGGGEKNGENEV